MAVLEQVIKMKGQGLSEGDIVTELSQQGVSPREINDALRQAQIKSAISGSVDVEGMEPSIMSEENVPSPNEIQSPVYVPRTYEEEPYVQPETYPQEVYPPTPMEYAPQEQYYAPTEGYEQYGAGTDTNTVMEIADQIFSDRIRRVQKQVDDATEISSILQAKMENISDRLKKIEMIIDKLQIAILEKVGDYGRNLESVKKEMSMMQGSFSKMISPIRRVERKYSEEETSEEEPKKRTSKKK